VPSLEALDEAEAALGVRAGIVGTFADWANAPDFPREWVRDVEARGALPLISWEPWDALDGRAEQPAYELAEIAGGRHDALVDHWAAQVAAHRRPVMLRFAAEMNGDWLPWSTGVNGNHPGAYVAAWRRVRARFRRAGAANALWVWNPIAAYDGATALWELVPGERDVDWLAADGYNWGTARASGWQTYDDLFAATLAELRELAPIRPVMIAETGCAPDPRKAAWVADAFASAQAGGVDALVWFEFAKETDWGLTHDSDVAAAAGAAVRRISGPH
jgi:beta-mannanase